MAATPARRLSRPLVAGIAFLLGLLVVLPAETQDLAALARKEKERRAKVATPTKVLVEEDAKAGTTGAKPGSVTSLPDPSANTSRPPTQSASPDEQQAVWKARAADARMAIQRAQESLIAAERELETYRSDRAVLSADEAQDPMRLQKREGHIKTLLAKVNLQKELLADAKKTLVVLEDEARKRGVPPGWLR